MLQWWFELPFWRTNWYVTMLVMGSASVATGVIAFVVTALSLLLRPKDRQPNLWGSSDFADRREMVSGGIKNKKRPF